MINTVLFDLGNVLLPFDVSRLANRLKAHSPFSSDEIINKLWNDHIANRFETGQMSPAEYFEHVSDLCEFKNLSFDQFVPHFNEIFDEELETIELLGKLKSNYQLGLISNTNPIHVTYILEKYSFLSHFDRHWFSNEAGVRKPDHKIFQMALTHFSIAPAESVFIDDMPENVESARKLGINGILYKSADGLKSELRTLGVTA